MSLITPIRCLLAVAACALALPVSSFAGDGKPLRGSDAGSFTLGTCSPGVLLVNIGGTGRASLVGRYDYRADECFDPATGTYGGSFAMVAANGDRLWGTYSGHVSGTSDPNVAAYHQDMTVAAGTGRFDGASGRIHVEGLANLVTGAYTQSLDGALGKGLIV